MYMKYSNDKTCIKILKYIIFCK